MAKIRPFHGVRYQLVKAGNPAKLVAPAFPLIDAERHGQLAESSPYNVVHLGRQHLFASDQGEAPTLNEWLQSGVVGREVDPVMYLYERNYTVEGERRTSRGLIALLEVDPTGDDVSVPFGEDPAGAATANAHFARFAQVNPYPVLTLYDDPDDRIDQLMERSRSPFPEVAITHDAKVEHRLFALRSPEYLAEIAAWFEDSRVLLASGVGLYNGVMRVSREQRLSGLGDRSSNAVLAFLVKRSEPGLVPRPYHRVFKGVPGFDFGGLVRSLSKAYDLQPVRSLRDVDGMLADARECSDKGVGFVLIGGGSVGRRAGYIGSIPSETILQHLEMKERSDAYRSIDLNVLDRLLFRPFLGVSEEEAEAAGYQAVFTDAQAAMQAGRAKDAQCLIMMNPLSVGRIQGVSDAGEALPERCLTFFPPLLSGLVMSDLSDV